MFVVNSCSQDADKYLAVSDQLNFSIIYSLKDLYHDAQNKPVWWDLPSESEDININTAQSIINLKLDQVLSSSHLTSLKGYYPIDEPPNDAITIKKMQLAFQVFHERDPNRLVIPVLAGVDRVSPIFKATKPDVMAIDVYPIGASNAPCDFTMTGYGYTNYDFVSYIREVTKARPANTPLWMILQTHKFKNPGEPFALREPSVAEVRAQNWMGIGEGATGIFWFCYNSEQGWTGLKDNPLLYPEVADLAQRVRKMKSTLLQACKTTDAFTVSGGGNPYISTLASKDKTKQYAVVVNRSCQQQTLQINTSAQQGQLKDLETGQTIALNSLLGPAAQFTTFSAERRECPR